MKKKLTANELIARVREYEIDHEPSGWPEVQMKLLSAMADELEALIEIAKFSPSGCHNCRHYPKPKACNKCWALRDERGDFALWERKKR